MTDNPQLNHAKKFAEQFTAVQQAMLLAQAVEVSIPEDVLALGRPQTGQVEATTPQPPPQAPVESKAGSASMKRPRTPKAEPGPA